MVGCGFGFAGGNWSNVGGFSVAVSYRLFRGWSEYPMDGSDWWSGDLHLSSGNQVMKVWLDDQINDPETPRRHTPEGYVGSSSVLEVCRWIKEGKVEYISFDHDLGDKCWLHPKGGYLVAKYIEWLAWSGKIKAISYDIHSANPVGEANIKMAMENAKVYWAWDRYEM